MVAKVDISENEPLCESGSVNLVTESESGSVNLVTESESGSVNLVTDSESVVQTEVVGSVVGGEPLEAVNIAISIPVVEPLVEPSAVEKPEQTVLT